MTYSVYQHWDPLKVCVVGRSYPPEFYDWITIPHVRELFEKIAIETEEDYQHIIKKLESFGVVVLRPELPVDSFVNDRWVPPPMTPRDYMVMIGNTFYENYSFDLVKGYRDVADPSWPTIHTPDEYVNLPNWIKDECNNQHSFTKLHEIYSAYAKIFAQIKLQGNPIRSNQNACINGAMISRIGRDLYFGTEYYDQDLEQIRCLMNTEFPVTRNHIVDTGGHSDGAYCPVCPGLIISLRDVPTYEYTFPGWEVVYLPDQSWNALSPFLKLKKKNHGRWWIPGFEHDHDVIDTVETWLSHWTGYVEETVFDVNMLIVDPQNVIVFNYNRRVFDALHRYGITAHVVPFRHRYFWDGGIHCVTTDLHREGVLQDWFPERK